MDLLGLILQALPQDLNADVELGIALYSLRQINKFFRTLHAAGLWITAEQQSELQGLARKFCEGFGQLASRRASAGYRMYKIRPKNAHVLRAYPAERRS